MAKPNLQTGAKQVPWPGCLRRRKREAASWLVNVGLSDCFVQQRRTRYTPARLFWSTPLPERYRRACSRTHRSDRTWLCFFPFPSPSLRPFCACATNIVCRGSRGGRVELGSSGSNTCPGMSEISVLCRLLDINNQWVAGSRGTVFVARVL